MTIDEILESIDRMEVGQTHTMGFLPGTNPGEIMRVGSLVAVLAPGRKLVVTTRYSRDKIEFLLRNRVT